MKILKIITILLIIIFIVIIAGCTPPRRLAPTDGRTIWIDEEYITRHGFDRERILKHETYHGIGKLHCPDRGCIMYPVYGAKYLCSKCDLTTKNWITEKINGDIDEMSGK